MCLQWKPNTAVECYAGEEYATASVHSLISCHRHPIRSHAELRRCNTWASDLAILGVLDMHICAECLPFQMLNLLCASGHYRVYVTWLPGRPEAWPAAILMESCV